MQIAECRTSVHGGVFIFGAAAMLAAMTLRMLAHHFCIDIHGPQRTASADCGGPLTFTHHEMDIWDFFCEVPKFSSIGNKDVQRQSMFLNEAWSYFHGYGYGYLREILRKYRMC